MKSNVTPKLRPWTVAEFPVGTAVRHTGSKNVYAFAFMNANDNGAWFSFFSHGSSKMDKITFDSLMRSYEYTTDFGNTWLTCGVSE